MDLIINSRWINLGTQDIVELVGLANNGETVLFQPLHKGLPLDDDLRLAIHMQIPKHRFIVEFSPIELETTE